MKTQLIPIRSIRRNEGQVEGLPTNPRQWNRSELDDLKKSIQETPELLEARGVLVYPHDGEFVVLGGNMRLTACEELGMEDVPCIIVPEDTPVEKLREMVIKDNGAFGAWDYDLLANEWDDLPLSSWGVPAWDTTEIDEDAVDALFGDDPAQSSSKALTITIQVPPALEDKLIDIQDAIEVTLADWQGCTIK